MGIAGDIVVIIVAALVGGLLAQRLHLPIILGYILAGIAVGPHTLGPSVVHTEDVELLADIGVALLLFTVGLEFPIERLAPVRRIALIGTPLQVLLMVLLGCGVGWCFNWSWQDSLWFGCMISVSSTMVVLKILSDRGLTGTLSSRVMTAILIMQDLAVIPMIVLLPSLDTISTDLGGIALDLSVGLVLVAIMVLVGSRFLPWFVQRVAGWRSREMFMVTVLGVGLGVGLITYQLHLSFAFGAFLAGMVLSRSEFNHQAVSEIVPLRDLFSLLFFVGVGMLIEPMFILEHWGTLLGLITIVFVGKALIFGLTTRLFGYVNIMPLAVGLYMFQVGEFAFVLARVGMSSKSISHELYLYTITIAAITIAITPFIAQFANPLYLKLRKKPPVQTIEVEDTSLSDHVVIIGYGMIGRFLCQAFKKVQKKVLVLEMNPELITEAREAGWEVIGGNASSPIILKASNLDRAVLVLITIPNAVTTTVTLRQIRDINPKLRVIARASSFAHLEALEQLGVGACIVPEYEAALGMLISASDSIRAGQGSIMRIVDYVRRHRYIPLLDDTFVNNNEMVQHIAAINGQVCRKSKKTRFDVGQETFPCPESAKAQSGCVEKS